MWGQVIMCRCPFGVTISLSGAFCLWECSVSGSVSFFAVCLESMWILLPVRTGFSLSSQQGRFMKQREEAPAKGVVGE